MKKILNNPGMSLLDEALLLKVYGGASAPTDDPNLLININGCGKKRTWGDCSAYCPLVTAPSQSKLD